MKEYNVIKAWNYKDNKELLVSKIKIGMWQSFCCEQDIYQIKSQEDLRDILDDYGDLGNLYQYVFSETYEELYDYMTGA